MPSVMSLPSVWHSAKVALPSVDSLLSVLGLALGKGCLCRVPDIWHSAKESALGIVELSGSDRHHQHANAAIGLERSFSAGRNFQQSHQL